MQPLSATYDRSDSLSLKDSSMGLTLLLRTTAKHALEQKRCLLIIAGLLLIVKSIPQPSHFNIAVAIATPWLFSAILPKCNSIVNGGVNGLAERKVWLAKFKKELGL